ncbi:MAG: HXXEE domain-containing protein [Bdellovibrionales bacterium]
MMFSTVALFKLLPLTLVLHCLEEWLGGFPEWATRHFGGITTRKFYFLSHVPIFAVVFYFSGTFHQLQNPTEMLLALIVLFILFTNGIFHLITTIWFREYSPGVITSLLCYFPFTILVCYQLLAENVLNASQLLLALLLGSIISLFVIYSLTWKKIL